MQDLFSKSENAANFLKGLASPHRLSILCCLSDGEKSVSEVIAITGLPQTSVSQHLAKLKAEGIVDFRREHRILYYRIVHPAAGEILAVLHTTFCKNHQEGE